MTSFHSRLILSAAALCCAAAIPLAASAQASAAPQPMRELSGPAHMNASWQDRGAKRHFARRGGDRGIRAMLHGLKLSEEQRDKVFAVLHAQAPQLRANAKQRRSAVRELRTLVLAENYDETRAKALSESLSQAVAADAMIRSRSANEIYQALTAEQRQLVQKRLERRAAHAQRG